MRATTSVRAKAAAAVRRLQRARRVAGFGDRLVVGEHTYFDEPPTVLSFVGDSAVVRIGAYCSVARDVQFMPGGQHRPDWVTTFPFRVMFGLPGMARDGHPRPQPDIVIGNDVWIGAGALVLGGVQIGDGAVVGARAVVTRDVRPYAVVAGNPAREVRRRFDDATVDRLLAVHWWTWPVEELLEAVDLLCDDDIDRFLDAAESRDGRA